VVSGECVQKKFWGLGASVYAALGAILERF